MSDSLFVPTAEESRRYFESRLSSERIGSRRTVTVKCPFHNDRKASLSVNLEKGTWYCHACCIGGGLLDFERRLTGKPESDCWRAINTTIGRENVGVRSDAKQIAGTYDYTDAAGKLLYQSVRYEPKEFRQRQPDGQGGWKWKMDGVVHVPFNLPTLVRANVVLIAEGEKDALNLQSAAAEFNDDDGNLVYAATTNIGGAGKWLDGYSPYLAGKKVFIFGDNDEPGRKHVQQVSMSVSKFAQGVHLVELPGLAEHCDVSDYLEAHSASELFALMQSASRWTAPDISTGAPDRFRLVELGTLLAEPEVDVDYLVDGMLVRGTVSCLVAKPKVGKSTLARWLCLSIARGAEFLGRSTQQGNCIYIALEERAEEIKADFRAMGATGTEPITVHADTSPQAAILTLAELVRKERPALVIVDPLIRLVRLRDENGYAEVYAALAPLIDAARSTGTHILLTHHSGKALKTDAIDSPLGSTAIGGAVATLIVLKRTDSYRSIQTVQRVGEDLPETVLAFDPETRQLSIGGTKAERDLGEIEKEIIFYLRDVGQPQTESEICDHVGGRTALKRNALRSLVEKREVGRIGTGRKGDPFKYLFPCSRYTEGTREQESENHPQTIVDVDENLVPERPENLILFPGELKE